MGAFIDQIKTKLKQKDILIRIISINVIIFLVLCVFNVITTLFKLSFFNPLEYIGVSSNISTLLYHPWTILTYMFVHEGFFHILFNLLILYWFGQIFLSYFNPKNLGSLYVLGGLAGAALYILAFNTIPYYQDLGLTNMIGASASVTAIIFAAAFYRPNAEVQLLIFGRIKIIYIAIFIFILDFISLGDKSNPGGHLAHIGGAILGYIYAKQYLKGKDITAWLNRLIDAIVNLFKTRPKKAKMNVKYHKREDDYSFNQKKKASNEEIDIILDKIKSSGYSSLSKDEKKRLFDASKR